MKDSINFGNLERINPLKFTYDNMCRSMNLDTIVRYSCVSGKFTLEEGWEIIGWSDRIDPALMTGRDGQIGILCFHKEWGESWHHVPRLEDDTLIYLKKSANT